MASFRRRLKEKKFNSALVEQMPKDNKITMEENKERKRFLFKLPNKL